jgi:hypothetical protein
MQIRRTAAALTTAAALSFTGIAMATPASAAPVVTGGLVNVTITDVAILNDAIVSVEVLKGVTLAVAANVCGTTINALAVDLGPDGAATCNITQDADSTTTTTVTQRR